jgi:hypothetical protein
MRPLLVCLVIALKSESCNDALLLARLMRPPKICES